MPAPAGGRQAAELHHIVDTNRELPHLWRNCSRDLEFKLWKTEIIHSGARPFGCMPLKPTMAVPSKAKLADHRKYGGSTFAPTQTL
jgi:hypothetical protein